LACLQAHWRAIVDSSAGADWSWQKWHGLLLRGAGPARRAAEEPKRSQCNAQPCRAAQRQCVWHEMAAASCRAAEPDTNYDGTADAAVPHPKLEITPPGWCRWSVQSNKGQHVAPQLIPLPRSYSCAPLPNKSKSKWRQKFYASSRPKHPTLGPATSRCPRACSLPWPRPEEEA